MSLQTIYVQTKNGEQRVLSVQAGENFLSDVHENLKVSGLSEPDLDGSILSLSPFKTFADVEKLTPLADDLPVWKPTSKSDVPPERYPATDTIVCSNATDVYLAVDFFNTAYWLTPAMIYTSFGLFPMFPAGTQLQYGRHWDRVYTETVAGPQKFTRSISRTDGSSVTDSITLGAELGVTAAGISAKLSASTSHSVTISSSTQVTDSYDISADKGEVNVWTLWQMVEVFTITDASGNPITYQGCLVSVYTGDPMDKFPVMFPPGLLTNRKPQIYSDVTTFPA